MDEFDKMFNKMLFVYVIIAIAFFGFMGALLWILARYLGVL